MGKRRYILWSLIFSGVLALLATLFTSWNYVLIKFSALLGETGHLKAMLPWPWLVFGSLGFCVVLAGLISLFVMLITEIRRNQLQAIYLTRITHELKTPLATIELSSSLLRAQDLEPGETEILWNSHQRELNRLKSNVDSLLLAARFDAKLFKPRKQNLNLETWIQSNWPQWQQVLGEGSQLTRSGGALDGVISTDPEFLKLITDNIIGNARKYAVEKPQINIHTEFVGDDRGWEIQFKDRGWGFDAKHQKKIFKPFFRSVSTKSRSIPGTGLGLFLARSAARRLGLKLSAKSDGVGQGASFNLAGRWA